MNISEMKFMISLCIYVTFVNELDDLEVLRKLN